MLLGRLTQAAVMLLGFLLPAGARAQRRSAWSVRRARAADASELAAIFNAHAAAGICPYSDLIEPWTEETATETLQLHTGTLILDREGIPVAFASLIDYLDPACTSGIAPGAEPTIEIVAFHPDRLSPSELLPAAKRLAVHLGAELRRMGFEACRMRLPAQPILTSNDWYVGHMQVNRVRYRDGVEHAQEVSFNVPAILSELERQGLRS